MVTSSALPGRCDEDWPSEWWIGLVGFRLGALMANRSDQKRHAKPSPLVTRVQAASEWLEGVAGDRFHAHIITTGNEGRARSLALAWSKEASPMKPSMPAALFIALSTVALAKPTPIELPTTIVKPDIMNMGSIGAMRERQYFEGAQSPIKAFPCRSEPVLFDKVRVAQSCR